MEDEEDGIDLRILQRQRQRQKRKRVGIAVLPITFDRQGAEDGDEERTRKLDKKKKRKDTKSNKPDARGSEDVFTFQPSADAIEAMANARSSMDVESETVDMDNLRAESKQFAGDHRPLERNSPLTAAETLEEDEEDEEDEVRAWEMEVMGRGGVNVRGQIRRENTTRSGKAEVDKLEVSLKKVNERITEMAHRQALDEKSLSQMQSEEALVRSQIEKVQHDLDEKKEKLRKISTIVGFVDKLVAHLQGKIDKVETVVEATEKLNRDRLAFIRDRRLQRIVDVLWKIEKTDGKAFVISHGDDNGAFPFDEFKPSENDVDDMGRSVAFLKESTLDERLTTQNSHHELPQTLLVRRQRMIKGIGLIFENEDHTKVANEAIDFFAQWKREFPGEYNQAFVSLSLTEILAPFVYLELCKRDFFGHWGDPEPATGWIFERSEPSQGFFDTDARSRICKSVVVPYFISFAQGALDLCRPREIDVLVKIVGEDMNEDLEEVLGERAEKSEQEALLPLLRPGGETEDLCKDLITLELESSMNLLHSMSTILASISPTSGNRDKVFQAIRRLVDKQVRMFKHLDQVWKLPVHDQRRQLQSFVAENRVFAGIDEIWVNYVDKHAFS